MPILPVVIHVRRSVDNKVVAVLEDTTVAELVRGDAASDLQGRWVAYNDGEPFAITKAVRRADGHVLIIHRPGDESAFGPLLTAAAADVAGPLHIAVRNDRPAWLSAAEGLGFITDHVSMHYEVPLAPVLEMLGRVERPTSVEIVSASQVDHDALFALDAELRNDVPGSALWWSSRAAFDDEMDSPEYDPTGYFVARGASGELVGLCRFWHNSDGPSLGMLGVVESHRHGAVAFALLRKALTGAAGWEGETFSTTTARPALQRRLRRFGAVEAGGFVWMTRR